MTISSFYWAWEMRLSPETKIVLLHLADGWVGDPDSDSEELQGTYAELAELCCCREAEVIAALTKINALCLGDFVFTRDRYRGALRFSDPALARSRGPAPKPISKSVRRRVIDKAGGRCVTCGATEDLCADHIHPRSRGGSDDENNLQALCRTCNTSKGAKTMEEWGGYNAT